MLLICFGFNVVAYVVEGIFLAAVMALTFGGFCLGSFVYHWLRGHACYFPAGGTAPGGGSGFGTPVDVGPDDLGFDPGNFGKGGTSGCLML